MAMYFMSHSVIFLAFCGAHDSFLLQKCWVTSKQGRVSNLGHPNRSMLMKITPGRRVLSSCVYSSPLTTQHPRERTLQTRVEMQFEFHPICFLFCVSRMQLYAEEDVDNASCVPIEVGKKCRESSQPSTSKTFKKIQEIPTFFACKSYSAAILQFIQFLMVYKHFKAL